ncbi:MAG: outer membrane protein assembly factor BamD [Sphingomonadales bacterium]
MRALAISLVCVVTLLTACSSDDRERKFVARDVGALYNLGKDYLERGRYTDAAVFFDEVERQHPYSLWARRAQLMSAYAYYRANKYDDAVLSAERFLTLHPGNKETDYAYYLIAICHYERIIDVTRDQKMTQRALQALREVERRFPESDYAEDAKLKIDMTRDHLAGKEMEVGRYYQRRGQHLAAVGRFKTVVDRYDTTRHTPEALHRMTESFLSLGIRAEAQKSAAILGYNYPGSKWYRYSYDLIQDKG